MSDSRTSAAPGADLPGAELPRASASMWSRFVGGLHIAQVRLRFIAVFVLVFLIVGNWDTISHYWQRWVSGLGLPGAEVAVSSTTEFFCPMCPGVRSAWPGTCPVCSMPLVRRTKGEMGILPDGSLVRMQISPYRLQLGGIATTRVEYRELRNSDGVLWAEEEPYKSQPRGAPELTPQELRVAYVCAQHPHKVRSQPGRCPLDATELVLQELGPQERLRWRCPLHPEVISDQPGGTCPQCADLPLLAAVVEYAPQEMVLAVPETAVVEAEGQHIVFQQTSPGVFDAIRVELKPATEGYHPVISGIKRGSDIVSQGAFLLDAETRLDPDLAATYFGADTRGASGGEAAVAKKSSSTDVAALLAKLKLSDRNRAFALRQRVCPVTGLPLGSMGAPVAASGAGDEVHLCCEGCRGKFERLHAEAAKGKYAP
jgi:hypothetical protein